MAAGEGSSGLVSRAEEPDITAGGREVAEAGGSRIVDVEVVAEYGRCEKCGKLNKRKTNDHFICFCTIISANEADQRPMSGGSGAQSGVRCEPRDSNNISVIVGEGSLSRRKLRNRLRMKKFLLKKAGAASGGQGSKN